MTFPLTWQEAEALAVSGIAIRRNAWNRWISHATGLWWSLDSTGARVEVVTASDVAYADLLADDWTTDPIGTTHDVCQLPPPQNIWVAPPLTLTMAAVGSDLILTATLGLSDPLGIFTLVFSSPGSDQVFQRGGAGTYTASIPLAGLTGLVGRVQVQSELPLPSWNEVRTATVPNAWALSHTTTTTGVIETVAVITNPFPRSVTISIAGVCDDDVAFDGTIYEPDVYPYWSGNPVGERNGAHSFSYSQALSIGQSITIGNRDNGGGGHLSAIAVIS